MFNIEINNVEGYNIPVSGINKKANLTMALSEPMNNDQETVPMFFNETSNQWETEGLSSCEFTNAYECPFTTSHLSFYRIFEVVFENATELVEKSNVFMLEHPEKIHPKNTDLYES